MKPETFLKDTYKLVMQIETRFLELAARLYKIRDEKIWEGSHGSYQDFLDEIHVSRGNAAMLEAVHKAYVIEGKAEFKQIGTSYSKLYEAIPLIGEKGVDYAILTANTQTRSDIKELVREKKHGECAHEETITICAHCHQRI